MMSYSKKNNVFCYNISLLQDMNIKNIQINIRNILIRYRVAENTKLSVPTCISYVIGTNPTTNNMMQATQE